MHSKDGHYYYKYGDGERPIVEKQITVPYKTPQGMAEKKFTAYPCGRSGGAGLNFLYVTFTPAQKDVVKEFSSSIMTCETIKVKLTTQQAYSSTWNAQMLEVVKE